MIQHVQLPHELGTRNVKEVKLLPVDKLVYVYMRKHANEEGSTFASVSLLAQECGINRRTVMGAIERLLQTQELYLDISSDSPGRSKRYKFNMQSEHFEMFSFECLKELQDNYSVNEKCVLIGIHELEFKKETYGCINYSLQELATKINMSLATLKRTIKSLEDKGVMLAKKIPGKQGVVRHVDYKKIFQDILYTKEKVEQHDNQIKDINERLDSLQEKFDYMVQDRDFYKNKYLELEKEKHRFLM